MMVIMYDDDHDDETESKSWLAYRYTSNTQDGYRLDRLCR